MNFKEKVLFANGCSLMAGDYYTDTDEDTIEWQSSRSPASKLGNILEFSDVINHAQGGCSNERIYRTTLNFISNNKNNLDKYFFLIGWTAPDRKEFSWRPQHSLEESFSWKSFSQKSKVTKLIYYDDDYVFQTTSGDVLALEDAKINDSDLKKFIELYWMNHGASLANAHTRMYIIGLQNILENLNVDYYFYNAIVALHLQPNNWKNLIKTDRYLEPFSLKFTESDYLDSLGFKRGKCNHFDHDGNQQWAELLAEKIKILHKNYE